MGGGKELPGAGHCFGSKEGECSGFTLNSCAVYKCPWYMYYIQSPPDCKGMSATCGTVTNADDPDFYRSTPARPFLDSTSCYQNCIDPTVGCNGGPYCNRTFTCDPASDCAKCSAKLPIGQLQGLQVNKGFIPGIWTFYFTKKAGGYSAVQVSMPNGTQWSADVTAFTGETASFVHGKDYYGVRFDFSATGALAQNVYIAQGSGTKIPDWGNVLTSGKEFALNACQYNGADTISGRWQRIKCVIPL
eukprot:NODE_1485_length_935_cov_24.550790_g1152_i0.p1 GENE.NODE_1485_length_935_cov_24.550790_g1152_i0~~NODE_1485_length_935_cov_24.550790_g1152_i0.p1  ORF type:complete len:246 (+),score=57.82 NODE_1485_length_935_cov_24.550790_g1152_i0:60-797(+)